VGAVQPGDGLSRRRLSLLTVRELGAQASDLLLQRLASGRLTIGAQALLLGLLRHHPGLGGRRQVGAAPRIPQAQLVVAPASVQLEPQRPAEPTLPAVRQPGIGPWGILLL